MMTLTINREPIELVMRKEELFWIQEPLRLKNAMRDIVETIGAQSSSTKDPSITPSFADATLP